MEINIREAKNGIIAVRHFEGETVLPSGRTTETHKTETVLFSNKSRLMEYLDKHIPIVTPAEREFLCQN